MRLSTIATLLGSLFVPLMATPQAPAHVHFTLTLSTWSAPIVYPWGQEVSTQYTCEAAWIYPGPELQEEGGPILCEPFLSDQIFVICAHYRNLEERPNPNPGNRNFLADCVDQIGPALGFE